MDAVNNHSIIYSFNCRARLDALRVRQSKTCFGLYGPSSMPLRNLGCSCYRRVRFSQNFALLRLVSFGPAKDIGRTGNTNCLTNPRNNPLECIRDCWWRVRPPFMMHVQCVFRGLVSGQPIFDAIFGQFMSPARPRSLVGRNVYNATRPVSGIYLGYRYVRLYVG